MTRNEPSERDRSADEPAASGDLDDPDPTSPSNARPRADAWLLAVTIVRDGDVMDGQDGDPPETWIASTWSADGTTLLEAIERSAAALSRYPGLVRSPSSVTIALLSDVEVAALNAQFRGQPKPTNVLSFPAPAPLKSGPARSRKRAVAADHFLGDIALAEETILREARELGRPAVHHLQHLVVHGILHLLGYDHDTDEAAERMETLEASILLEIGVPDPYSHPSFADPRVDENSDPKVQMVPAANDGPAPARQRD